MTAASRFVYFISDPGINTTVAINDVRLPQVDDTECQLHLWHMTVRVADWTVYLTVSQTPVVSNAHR